MENNKKISVDDKDIDSLSFSECTFRILGIHQRLDKMIIQLEYLTEQLEKTKEKITELNYELKMVDRHSEIQFHKERLWNVSWQEREKMDADKLIKETKKRHAKEDGLL